MENENWIVYKLKKLDFEDVFWMIFYSMILFVIGLIIFVSYSAIFDSELQDKYYIEKRSSSYELARPYYVKRVVAWRPDITVIAVETYEEGETFILKNNVVEEPENGS
jgi:hypothetical protein